MIKIKSIKSNVQIGATNRVLIDELDEKIQQIRVVTSGLSTTHIIIFMSIILFIIIVVIWYMKGYFNRDVSYREPDTNGQR